MVLTISAERRTLARQCQCIAAWTFARLEQMREQYNEIFARMDDWIKDRVREENEAIKDMFVWDPNGLRGDRTTAAHW